MDTDTTDDSNTQHWPLNRHPLLLCEGSCGEASHQPHTFTDRHLRRGDQDVVGVTDFLFACDVCGTTRAFGCLSH